MNNNRRRPCYTSKEDAKIVLGSPLKKNLNKDPCLRYFHPGYNHDGYWDSSRTKFQLVDIIDVLTIISPSIDFWFYIINILDIKKADMKD